MAGKLADVYLAWIKRYELIEDQLIRANAQFAQVGRNPSYGLRTHIIIRDTEKEAWSAAKQLISDASDIVRYQRGVIQPDNPEIRRHTCAGKSNVHQIAPHLWTGISTVRVNCGTALVETYEQVAGELLGYWKLGIDEFILSGFPHIEECQRTSTELLPLVKSLINRCKEN